LDFLALDDFKLRRREARIGLPLNATLLKNFQVCILLHLNQRSGLILFREEKRDCRGGDDHQEKDHQHDWPAHPDDPKIVEEVQLLLVGGRFVH